MFKLSKLFPYYGSRKSTSNDSIIFHKRKEQMFIQLLLISGQAFFLWDPGAVLDFLQLNYVRDLTEKSSQ